MNNDSVIIIYTPYYPIMCWMNNVILMGCYCHGNQFNGGMGEQAYWNVEVEGWSLNWRGGETKEGLSDIY